MNISGIVPDPVLSFSHFSLSHCFHTRHYHYQVMLALPPHRHPHPATAAPPLSHHAQPQPCPTTADPPRLDRCLPGRPCSTQLLALPPRPRSAPVVPRTTPPGHGGTAPITPRTAPPRPALVAPWTASPIHDSAAPIGPRQTPALPDRGRPTPAYRHLPDQPCSTWLLALPPRPRPAPASPPLSAVLHPAPRLYLVMTKALYAR
jgi:hypothetical protein